MSCSFLLSSWLVPCPVQWVTSIFSCLRWGSSPCEYYVDAQLPQQNIFASELKSKWRHREDGCCQGTVRTGCAEGDNKAGGAGASPVMVQSHTGRGTAAWNQPLLTSSASTQTTSDTWSSLFKAPLSLPAELFVLQDRCYPATMLSTSGLGLGHFHSGCVQGYQKERQNRSTTYEIILYK